MTDYVEAPLPNCGLVEYEQKLLEVLSEPFSERITDTLSTFGKELTERGQTAQRLGYLVLGGAGQVADRFRLMAFVLPTAFDETLQFTTEQGYNGYATAALAAGVVGSGFTLWGQAIGRSFRRAINAFPATTKKVTENHPVMVGVIEDAIDGFPSKEQLKVLQPEIHKEGYEIGPYDTRSALMGKVALGVNRSWRTALLFGTTAHVGVSKVNQHTEESVTRRINATSAEAGAFLGVVAATVSGLVTHNAFGAADEIRDTVSNEKLWMGISVGLVGYSALVNYLSRKGYIKKQQEATEEKAPWPRNINLETTNEPSTVSGINKLLTALKIKKQPVIF